MRELRKGAEEQAIKQQKANEEARAREMRNAAAQQAAGDVVVERLSGQPMSVEHDVAAKTLNFTMRATVGAPELLTTNSAVYYEFEVLERSEGIAQIRFALEGGITRCDTDTDFKGVGENSSSWGVDGIRCCRWEERGSGKEAKTHQHASWNCKWHSGDVIGVAANVDMGKIAISKNGIWEHRRVV